MLFFLGGIRNNPIPVVNFGSRLHATLFANVNRSIDELYQLCEEEGNEEMCQDGLDLLERSGRDFRLLSDRIDEQRKFGLDQSAGISWEVRNVRALYL